MNWHARLLGVKEQSIPCETIDTEADCIADPHPRIAHNKNQGTYASGVFEPISCGCFDVQVGCSYDPGHLVLSERHRWLTGDQWWFEVSDWIFDNPLASLCEPKESS